MCVCVCVCMCMCVCVCMCVCIIGSTIYSYTFYKDIYSDRSFQVPEHCQHDLLYWRQLYLFHENQYWWILSCPKRLSAWPSLLSTVVPFSRKSIVIVPFRFQKTVSMTFITNYCAWNFLFTGESVFLLNELSFWFRLLITNPCLTYL